MQRNIYRPSTLLRSVRYLLVLLALFATIRLDAAQPVRIGVLAPRGEAHALATWIPTVDYLDQAVPGYQFNALALELDSLEAAVADGSVDFVLTNPGQFILLGAPHELSWLATLRNRHNGSFQHGIGSVLLVRKDSPFHQPLDLRGRPVGAVHPRAFGGFLLLQPRLAEHGIAPESAYQLQFLGYPLDSLLYQLRDGILDGAIVPACLLEEMTAEELLQADQFRALMPNPVREGCLSSTPTYPGWSFAALPHVPERLTTMVARALLAEENDATQWSAPSSPAQLETLLQELRLHPLQQPLWLEIQDTLQRYWHYTLLAAVIALAGLTYHLWLQGLALRRTRELAAAHQRLREREQQLATAQRMTLLGELAAGLAHELNQPLAAIRHYAEGCTVRLARQDAQHPLLPALNRIDQEAARGAAVVEQARRWLRQEPPPLTALPLNELITELLQLHEPRLQRQDISVEVHIDPPELRVHGNRLALEQVLSNLIGNSLQAYEAQQRRGSIVIEAHREATEVSIRLRDQAGGFSAERLHQPFTPFRSTRPEGLGLGLLICQRLMQAQGGTLTLANTASGAEINLTLPAESA